MIIFIILLILTNFFKKLRFTFIKNRISYIKQISYDAFLELEFTIDKKRFDHLNLLTNNLKYTKIKDVINYIKNNKHNFKIEERKVTEMINTGDKKLNSIYFWNKGNSLLYYNVIYEFKKNVIEYQKINLYINNYDEIYSEKYYKNLKSMNDFEIKEFLFNNYLILYKKNIKVIKHGFHRIFAMIGRLINNKTYIPFYAAIL